MTFNDDDLKKAFRQQEIPPPDTNRREEAIRKATELFMQKKGMAEKKRQGSSFIVRLMGKILELVTPSTGEPIMTTRRLATIGIAVLALGFALSTPLFMRPHKATDLATEPTAPEQVATLTTPGEPTPTAEPGPPAAAQNEIQKLEEAMSRSADKRRPLAEAKGKELFAREDRVAEAEVAASAPAPPPAVAFKSLAPKKMRPGRPLMADHATLGQAGEEGTGYYRDSGRDVFEKTTPNPVKLATEEPVSTFSIDVDTASYAFVRRQLNNGVLPQKNAVRIEELINYFDYDYAVPRDRSKPFAPTVAVYPSPWNKGTKLLHIGIKGYELPGKEKPRANLVFLIDVSGSMNSPDKLPLLKNSLALLVDTLAPEDTVAIVVYAGAAGAVLDPTPVKEKGKILAALDRLQAGGSTAGGAGIKLAYSLAEANFQKKAVNRVILATDGDFNVGITNQEELKSYIERERQTGISLSVLGFGQGNYNDALMQALAQNGNGNAAYIDSLNEARKVLVDEASATLFTIAKDVKIQVEFNPAMVHDYRLIGYETRLLNREDFNNDQVDAGEVGAGHTVTALYEITPVGSSAKLIDELRYREETAKKPAATKSSEYAFVKIRYKLPDSDSSLLITKPVDHAAEFAEFAAVPVELRFAAAVAGFGQLLRNAPYTGDFGYDQVLAIGQEARGKDAFGYRSEFLNLVRLAKSARRM